MNGNLMSHKAFEILVCMDYMIGKDMLMENAGMS